MEMMNKLAEGRRLRVLEDVLLALMGLYLLALEADITTFDLPNPVLFRVALLGLMGLAVAARTLAMGLRRREVWIGVGIGVAYALSFVSVRHSFLPLLAVMTVGLVGVDYRRVLKAYLLSVGALLLVAVIAAMAGAIDNLVYFRDGVIRSAWGTLYPTDFASAVLFALVMLWVAFDRLPDWALLPGCAVSLWISRCIAGSRTSFACGLLFVAMILYVILERSALRGRRLSRIVDALLPAAFPVFAAGMLFLIYAYSRGYGFAVAANGFLSDRLRLALEAIRAYGVKPFGVRFEQIGAGFSTFQSANYNFVDSSYPLMLLRCGWALSAVIGVLWVWMTCRAVRRGNRRLALALTLIAFHSISEQHFIEPNFNILLALPLAAWPDASAPAERGRVPGRRAAGIVVALLCAGAAWALPAVFSWLRTMFSVLGLTGGGTRGFVVIALILAMAAACAGIAWGLYRLLASAFARKPADRRAIAALALCAALGIGGFVLGNTRIERFAADKAEIIEAERPAIELATAVARGGVYADDLPEIYRRRFEGIGRTILCGDDCARLGSATVLTAHDHESYPMLQRGFRFAEISPEHALYTSDSAVIEALETAGYATTDYYSAARSVDLARVAALNGLEYTEDRGLRLDGAAEGFSEGPFAELYAGDYTVRYRLRLDGSVAADDVVCTLRVTANYGADTLAEKRIKAKKFDADGALSAKLKFTAGSCQGVAFEVCPAEGVRLEVEKITCRQTPAEPNE